jgi:hypothetical protein
VIAIFVNQQFSSYNNDVIMWMLREIEMIHLLQYTWLYFYGV